jgi:hypothetical protein
MAQELRDGDLFPAMRVQTVAHGELAIPDDLKSRWTVLLYYRGWW